MGFIKTTIMGQHGRDKKDIIIVSITVTEDKETRIIMHTVATPFTCEINDKIVIESISLRKSESIPGR